MPTRPSDIRALRNALDGLRSEHLSRPASASRDDLIRESAVLGERALAINIPQFAAVAALRRAEMEIALERWTDALGSLRKARHSIDGLAVHEHGVFLLRMEAEAYAGLGRWDDVRRVTEEGIAIVEPSRHGVTPRTLQSSYLRLRVRLYELAVRAALERGDLESAIRTAELVKCRSLSLPVVEAGDAPSDTELIDEFREVCRKIDEVEARGGHPDPLLARRRALWHLLQIERSAGRSRHGTDLSLSAIQASLGEDEAVVTWFWTGAREVLVAALSRNEKAWELVGISARERARIEELAAALQTTKPPHSAAQLPRFLTDRLFPAEIRPVLDGRRRLLLSPHRALHALPLHALRWDDGYLLERFAITYVPNLTAVLQEGADATQPRVLALGVTECRAPPASAWPPLADAVAEVRDLVAVYGAERCEGRVDDEASAVALRSLDDAGTLPEFGVLHFACHGLNIDSDNPMESKLFLRDTALDGLDLATFDARARLVVLSACCSGQRPVAGRGMEELPGDDLFGLQAAFFAAGADRIVSTMWPVDSHSARIMAVDFHRRLNAGNPTDLALQGAVLEYLRNARESGDLMARQPYFWAPFFLVARNREARNPT